MIFTAAGRFPAMKAASAVQQHGAGLTKTRATEVRIMANNEGSTRNVREPGAVEAAMGTLHRASSLAHAAGMCVQQAIEDGDEKVAIAELLATIEREAQAALAALEA